MSFVLPGSKLPWREVAQGSCSVYVNLSIRRSRKHTLRADDIAGLKQRNAKKRADLDRISQKNGIVCWEQLLGERKQESRARRIASEKAMKEKKNQFAKHINNERKQGELATKKQKNEARRSAAAMRESIVARQNEVKAQRKAKQAAQAAAAEAKRLKIKKIEGEKMRTELALKTIQDMEAEEERLIANLRATQDGQKNAYLKLEEVLNS